MGENEERQFERKKSLMEVSKVNWDCVHTKVYGVAYNVCATCKWIATSFPIFIFSLLLHLLCVWEWGGERERESECMCAYSSSCLLLPLRTGAEWLSQQFSLRFAFDFVATLCFFPIRTFPIVRLRCVHILFIIFELTCWELQIFEESAQQRPTTTTNRRWKNMMKTKEKIGKERAPAFTLEHFVRK